MVFSIFIMSALYYFVILFEKLCICVTDDAEILKRIESSFISEYLFSYWALAHPIFKTTFLARFTCEISDGS